ARAIRRRALPVAVAATAALGVAAGVTVSAFTNASSISGDGTSAISISGDSADSGSSATGSTSGDSISGDSISGDTATDVAAVAGVANVTAAEPVEAVRVKVNGTLTAVLGVSPSGFRGFAAQATAASDNLWRGVAGGGIAVSYTMGKLDHLPLGGTVTLSGTH